MYAAWYPAHASLMLRCSAFLDNNYAHSYHAHASILSHLHSLDGFVYLLSLPILLDIGPTHHLGQSNMAAMNLGHMKQVKILLPPSFLYPLLLPCLPPSLSSFLALSFFLPFPSSPHSPLPFLFPPSISLSHLFQSLRYFNASTPHSCSL